MAGITIETMKSRVARVGAPIRTQEGLFNCAIALLNGQILAVVPKTYLPNYREFYEKRYFVSAEASRRTTIKPALSQKRRRDRKSRKGFAKRPVCSSQAISSG